MKQVVFTLIVFFLSLLACKKQTNEDQITELAKYNMKFIPESPTSKDEINLVVFSDCKYNRLSSVKRNGKTINIEKQFNSMIKLACVLHNDTILIGKLPQGDYTVNYQLVDIANPASPQISLSASFNLPVASGK